MNFPPDQLAHVAGDPLAQGALQFLAHDLGHQCAQALFVEHRLIVSKIVGVQIVGFGSDSLKIASGLIFDGQGLCLFIPDIEGFRVSSSVSSSAGASAAASGASRNPSAAVSGTGAASSSGLRQPIGRTGVPE